MSFDANYGEYGIYMFNESPGGGLLTKYITLHHILLVQIMTSEHTMFVIYQEDIHMRKSMVAGM